MDIQENKEVEEKNKSEEVENIEETSEEENSGKEEIKETENQGSSIFIIKVTTNKEERALEMISERAKKKKINTFAVLRPHGLRGYILLEAADRESAEEAVFNLPYVKGIIGKTVEYEEIKDMVESSVENVSIQEGDIVEIISEHFKREKAKVTRIDKQKEEVVVSLLGAVVPLPLTLKIDNVRVIRREEEDEH